MMSIINERTMINEQYDDNTPQRVGWNSSLLVYVAEFKNKLMEFFVDDMKNLEQDGK